MHPKRSVMQFTHYQALLIVGITNECFAYAREVIRLSLYYYSQLRHTIKKFVR